MFRHFSKMLIFTLLACVSSIGNAAVVSVEDARQTAIEFFLASRQERLASADALELVYTAEASSKPLTDMVTSSFLPMTAPSQCLDTP